MQKVGIRKTVLQPAIWTSKSASFFLWTPTNQLYLNMQTERTHVTYMAYKFYSGKLAQQLELKKYCHISGKLATRSRCKRRSVVYLANWTWYEIARGVFATATNEGGAKFNFGPPLRGSVRSPHKKVKANLFWGALGQPLKKQPSGGWSKRLTWSSKTSVGQSVTPRCYKLAYRLEQCVNNC